MVDNPVTTSQSLRREASTTAVCLSLRARALSAQSRPDSFVICDRVTNHAEQRAVTGDSARRAAVTTLLRGHLPRGISEDTHHATPAVPQLPALGR